MSYKWLDTKEVTTSGINGMNKLFFFILLLACSLFSQSSSVLFLHPNGPRYKKVEIGIKSELNNSINMVSLISKNETEIKNAIDNNSPKIAVVSSYDMIKIWKKLQMKYSELNQISSILLESELSENDISGFSNSCIVNNETKLGQYIECVNQLTGKRPQNIGVIYSSKSVKVAQAYQKEAVKLNVNVYDQQVIASDPEASIKSGVKNLTGNFKVEFILILDDPVTINHQNINTTWVALLSGLSIPVAVPADYFYEIEPKIGSLAIQQHFSAIGGVIASVINSAEADNWYIKQKYIYTDKCIFYFRNKDGSISKQNYMQNDIIASYNSKKEVVSVQPDSDVDKQPNANNVVIASEQKTDAIPNDNIVTASEEKTSFDNRKVSFEPETTSQNTILANSSVSSEKNVQNKENKEKPFKANDVNKTAPDEVASKYSDDMSDDVFSPANPIQEPDIENAQSNKSVSDTTQRSSQKQQSNLDQNILLSIMMFVFLIVVAIVVFVVLKKRSDKNKKKCLLITNNRKQINYSGLTNKAISLSNHLKICGFKIIVSKNLDQINDLLLFNLPEVICVDWQLESDIQMQFYKILNQQMLSADFILIFYNVPDTAKTTIGYYEDRTFYLHTEFAISDLNKILSIIRKRSRVSKQTDDKANPQLEGKIVGDSLTEIFQLMDINKKTGCLIVEDDNPVGTIFFEDGFVTYAISNTQVAEQAVFDILALQTGRFHFIPGKKPLSRQMQASVVGLLMAQAQSTDESTEFDLIN
jgi:hypothetical protein